MTKIKFYPLNKEVKFTKGKSVLETAFQNNIYIPSMCEEGTCATCMVKVIKGRHFLIENGKISTEESGNILACLTELSDDTENNEIEIMIYDE